MSLTNKRRGSAVLSAAAAAAIVVGASSSTPPPPCSSARPPTNTAAAAAAAATSSLSFGLGTQPSTSRPRPLNAPFGRSCRTVEFLRGGGGAAPPSSSTTETLDEASSSAKTAESGSHVAAADGSNVRGGAVGEKKSNKKKKKRSRKKSNHTKTANYDEHVDGDASADTTTHAEAREKEASSKNDEKSSEENRQHQHHRSTHTHSQHHHKHKSKTHNSNSQQDAIIASIMSASDHYEVLGVTKSASDVEIKKAYRRRAVRTHPDKVPNSDRSAFDKVAKAYEVLSDETKRGVYDRFGDAGVEAGGNPNPGAFAGFGSGGMFGAANAEEMFGRYFGGAGGRGGPNFNPFQPRNVNKRFQMEVDLEDLYNGMTRKVTMTHPPTSPSGRRKRKTVEVTVQRGMMTGQSILLPGEMDQVPNSAPADMIFVLAQRRHATFSRRGHDLATDVTISLREALCGFRRSFIHLDGRTVVIAPPRGKKIYQEKKKIDTIVDEGGEAGIDDEVERPREVPIEVPSIVRSGDVHVLKGEGMPKPASGHSRGGSYGDLYVQYKVEMPSAATGAGDNLTIEERDELERLLRKLEGSSSNSFVQGTELMGEEIDGDGNKIRHMQKASAEDYGRASGPFDTNEHHHGEEHLHGDDEDPNNSFFQAFGGRGFPASGFQYYSSSGRQDGNGEQQCQQM